MPRIVVISFALNLLVVWLFKVQALDQFQALAVWLALFVISLLSVTRRLFRKARFDWRQFLSDNQIELLLVLLLAFLPRIFLLGLYPHISVWDELRDSGLNALKLSHNELQLFGFGPYQGHGNFSPLLAYYALQIFGQSFLVYQVPAMILGTLAIGLLYLLVSYYKGKRFALFTSIFCSVGLTLLHYSRTEVVVISDAVLAILLFAAALMARKNLTGYLLLGLISGLTWHFYAGSRVILLCLLFMLLVLEIPSLYRQIRTRAFRELTERVINVSMYFLTGMIIALGPTALFLNEHTFFSSSAVNTSIFSDPNFLKLGLFNQIGYIFDLYVKGLGAYTTINAAYFHFYYPTALLSFPLNLLFVVGIVVLLLSKKSYFERFLLVLVLLHPLLAQALPNGIAFTHRLEGIVPFINIIACYGLFILLEKFIQQRKWQRYLLFGFTAVFYFAQLSTFFGQRVVDKKYDENDAKDYPFQFVLQTIATKPEPAEYFILNKTPFDVSFQDYQEKIEFLTSPKTVKVLNPEDFAAQLDKALQGNQTVPQVFISFKQREKLPEELQQKIPYMIEAKYTCHQELFGVLYDCPTNGTSYGYYYYTAGLAEPVY